MLRFFLSRRGYRSTLLLGSSRTGLQEARCSASVFVWRMLGHLACTAVSRCGTVLDGLYHQPQGAVEPKLIFLRASGAEQK